ncbi:MAG: hypothetical protein U0798_05645 [Gemmataceae bacterium]
MTALGKTLTVFIFLLSLVWCWLTVNAFTTRTNWKTQVDAAKDQTKQAVARAQEMEAAYTALVAKTDAQIKSLQDEVQNSLVKNTELQASLATLKTQFEKKIAVEREGESRMAIISKNQEATLRQLDLAKSFADSLEAKLTVATQSEQKAKNESLQQKLEADAFKTSNETLSLQLAQSQERIRDIMRGGSGLGAQKVVPVSSNIRASVTRVDGDLITISLGADAGIAKGAVLDIARFNPTKFLGKIRVSNVDPKNAVGTFESASGGKATGDNLPRIGDTVGIFGQ